MQFSRSELHSSASAAAKGDFQSTFDLLARVRNETDCAPLLTSLDECFDTHEAIDSQREAVLEESAKLKTALQDQIQEAQQACRSESDDLYRMQQTLQDLKAEHEFLLQNIRNVAEDKEKTRQRISQYDEEAEEKIESFDLVEAARLSEVKKLKEEISLYAMSTNIKWDYNQETLIAGEVTIASRDEIRRFSIDPREHSKFEVANYLWDLMSGKDEVDSVALSSE